VDLLLEGESHNGRGAGAAALTGELDMQPSRVLVGASEADEADGGAGLITLPPADGDDAENVSAASSVVSDLDAVLGESTSGGRRSGVASGISSAVPSPRRHQGAAAAVASPTGSAQRDESTLQEQEDHDPEDVAEWDAEDVAEFLQHQVGVSDAVITRVSASRLDGSQLLSLTDDVLRRRLGLRLGNADWLAVESARLRLLRV
jgi:hypothetical protein